MRKFIGSVLLLLAVLLSGIAILRATFSNTGPATTIPGEEKTADTHLLEIGARLLQGKAPLGEISMYLDGFHFYADDMGRQLEAHHFCSIVNEDFIQCVIYDGNTKDARLIGIEYVISEQLFKTLPEEEKRFWHSHNYEVKSGQLIVPGIPMLAEHELMKKLVSTYGKTWNTWDTHAHNLPVGVPSLMMGFTSDGQIKQEMQNDRDRRFGISTAGRKKNREDIAVPKLMRGANYRERGK